MGRTVCIVRYRDLIAVRIKYILKYCHVYRDIYFVRYLYIVTSISNVINAKTIMSIESNLCIVRYVSNLTNISSVNWMSE